MRRVALVFFLAIAGWASAQRTRGGDVVQLRIDTVLASNTGQEIDQRLLKMRRHFSSFRYSSFRLMQAESRTVQWGTPIRFVLPGGRALQVLPQDYKNDWVELRVSLFAEGEPLMETRLRIRNQGTILLGGPRYEEGVLIISITAGTE
jgi:hypothetical protein